MRIHVNGIEMFVEVSGEGIPVILLHGYPLDHSIWHSILPALSRDAMMITPDLRGHGQSDAPEMIYTMELIADDIAGLMDALELPKAVIIGHSMGGYASLAFSRRFPSRTAGLGLVASHSRSDSSEGRTARMESAKRIKENGMAEIASTMPGKLTARKELWPMLQNLIQGTRPAGAIGALQGMAGRPDLIDNLAEIEIPALVIAGGTDEFIPVDKARETAEKMPDCELAIFPAAGHLPMLENPTETVQAITGLLNRVKANQKIM